MGTGVGRHRLAMVPAGDPTEVRRFVRRRNAVARGAVSTDETRVLCSVCGELPARAATASHVAERPGHVVTVTQTITTTYQEPETETETV